MTYFSIDYGIYAVVITLSVSHGVGFSLMYAQAIGAITNWFIGNRTGKKICILIATYVFFSIWVRNSNQISKLLNELTMKI